MSRRPGSLGSLDILRQSESLGEELNRSFIASIARIISTIQKFGMQNSLLLVKLDDTKLVVHRRIITTSLLSSEEILLRQINVV